MTKFGSQFSATDLLKKASGITHNAGLRVYRNIFNLATDGGTSEDLQLADIEPGVCISSIVIESDQNLSTINFTVGITGAVAKYSASAAGPNATQQTRYPPLSLGIDPTAVREVIRLYPSANLPSTGTLRVTVFASHR